MSKSSQRLLTIVLLTVIGVVAQHVALFAQESDGGRSGRGNANGGRRAPTFIDPQSGQRLTINRETGAFDVALEDGAQASPDQPRDMIAINVWVLTVDHSAKPESEELVGKLLESTGNLPVAVGKIDEVRQLVSRLKVAGLLRKSREYRIATLDGQSATSQVGAQTPNVIGTSNNGGRRTSSINYQNVGTILQVTPKAEASGNIQVQFNYEASGAEPSKAAVEEGADGPPLMANQIVTQQTSTAVRLLTGNAVLVRSDSSEEFGGDTPGGQTHLIILGAIILPNLE